MRLLNALIGLGQPLGLTPGKLNVEKIMAKAKQNTGVEDLGEVAKILYGRGKKYRFLFVGHEHLRHGLLHALFSFLRSKFSSN